MYTLLGAGAAGVVIEARFDLSLPWAAGSPPSCADSTGATPQVRYCARDSTWLPAVLTAGDTETTPR